MAVSSIFNIPQLISRLGLAPRLLHFNLPQPRYCTTRSRNVRHGVLRGAPRQRAVPASFAKSLGSLRQVLRRLRRVPEVASWPRLGRLGGVWRCLAASGPRPGRVPAASRVWARVLPASLASLASGFGPGVVFRGRGFGPGVVSGVFFFASRARPASLARPGRVPGRLGRVPPRPGTRVPRVSAASPGPRVA